MSVQYKLCKDQLNKGHMLMTYINGQIATIIWFDTAQGDDDTQCSLWLNGKYVGFVDCSCIGDAGKQVMAISVEDAKQEIAL